MAALLAGAAGARPVRADVCNTCGIGTECCGETCYIPENGYCADPARGIVCAIGATLCEQANVVVCCLGECCGSNCCYDGTYCADPATGRCCNDGEAYYCNVCWANEPDCGTGQVFDKALCGCKSCDTGLIPCGNACVLACGPDQALDFTTCACKCLTACGDICCPSGQVCSSDGGAGGEAKCCNAGESCGAACTTDPGVLCCQDSGSKFACVAGTHTCCPSGGRGGPNCCLKGKETCDRGACVKKKRRKHKRH